MDSTWSAGELGALPSSLPGRACLATGAQGRVAPADLRALAVPTGRRAGASPPRAAGGRLRRQGLGELHPVPDGRPKVPEVAKVLGVSGAVFYALSWRRPVDPCAGSRPGSPAAGS